MVIATISKIKYYFEVYNQGADFKKAMNQSLVKIKVMPDYTIPNKIVCICGHALTIGKHRYIGTELTSYAITNMCDQHVHRDRTL